MNRILFPADQVGELARMACGISDPIQHCEGGELRVKGSAEAGIMLQSEVGGEMIRVYALGCRPMQQGRWRTYCEQVLKGKSLDSALPWECLRDHWEMEDGYWELVLKGEDEALLLHVSEKEYAAHRTFCIGQNLLHLVVVESL